MNILLSKFVSLAAVKHQEQFDKSGKPYILHCLTVMNGIMRKYPDDYELMCIAVGHDLIEDTDVTFKDLEAIGATERVIEGIDYLTKHNGQTYDEYVECLMNNKDAMLVKLEDLKHNLDVTRLVRLSGYDIERINKYNNLYRKIMNKLGL